MATLFNWHDETFTISTVVTPQALTVGGPAGSQTFGTTVPASETFTAEQTVEE